MSWTVIYTSPQPHLIEIVKYILSYNNLNFVIVDKRDSMYASVKNAGIEVHIQSSDFILGKKLVESLEAE